MLANLEERPSSTEFRKEVSVHEKYNMKRLASAISASSLIAISPTAVPSAGAHLASPRVTAGPGTLPARLRGCLSQTDLLVKVQLPRPVIALKVGRQGFLKSWKPLRDTNGRWTETCGRITKPYQPPHRLA